MQTDAELFGLGKKTRKLKPGETGTEEGDYVYGDAVESPEPVEAPEKNTPSYNGNDGGGMSYTQPVGTPVAAPSDIAPVVPAATPKSAASVGHDGTYNGMTREQYRDAWMSSGVNSVQGAKDWLAKNGGTWISDNGTVETPFGEVLDMGGNARGSLAGNGPLTTAWTPTGADKIAVDSGASAAPSTDLASLIASGGQPVPQSAGVTTSAGASSGNINDELANLLAGGVDSDPSVAAYKRSAAKSFRNLRSQAAESAANNGTISSGGFNGQLRGLAEDEAEAVAGFTGERAADVQRLKVQADQTLRQLGFNYASLDQQQRQWLGNLNQNRDQFLASLGLSERQLNAQQKNALDQLGLAYDQLEYSANRDATLAALR